MDPLSITASAVALAANVLRAALFIKDAVDQFQDAPALARDIQAEVTIVQTALVQVEAVLQRDHQAIRRFRLQVVFDLSVEGCRDALHHISEELEGLYDRDDWKASFVLWWNAGDIRRWLARLETKKGSLALLVQALSLHSVQEMQELLHQNMATLDLARFGLDDMVPSYPACTAGEWDTVASAIGSDASVFGDRESVLSNTRFAFDTICFDSKAYRHTVARVSAKKKKNSTRETATDAASAAQPHDMNLPPVQEAESDDGSSARTARPPPRATVTTEEHEAVLMKLREAEALIQTLQGQIQQPKPFVAAQDAEALDHGPTRGVDEEVEPAKTEPLKPATSIAAEPDGKSSDSTQTADSVPNDGAPITIRPAARPARPKNISQTSLLIEYFESSKKLENPRLGKPSVKVRVTPRKGRKPKDQASGFISIPATRDRLRFERKQSASRCSAPGKQTGAEPIVAEPETGTAISSMPPSSLLGGTKRGDGPPLSVISSIPPCSFLDGPESPSFLSRQDEDDSISRFDRPPRTRRNVKGDLTGPTESAMKDPSETPGNVRHVRNDNWRNNPKLLETVEDAIKRLILPELELQRAEQQRSLGVRGSRTVGSEGTGSTGLKTEAGTLTTDTGKKGERVPLKDTTNLERETIAFSKSIRAEKAGRRNPGTRRTSVDAPVIKSDHEEERVSRSPAPASRRASGQRDCPLIPPIPLINLPSPLEEHEETGKSFRPTPHSPLMDAHRSMSPDPRGPFSPGLGEKNSTATASRLSSVPHEGALGREMSPSATEGDTTDGAEETEKTISQPTPLPALSPDKVKLLDTSLNSRDATTPDLEDTALASGNKDDEKETTGLSAHPAQSSADLDNTKKVNDRLNRRDRRTLRIDTKRVIAEINKTTEELLDAHLQRPRQAGAVERAARKESRFRRALTGLAQSKNSTDLANVEAALARLLDQVQEVKQQTQAREGHAVGAA